MKILFDVVCFVIIRLDTFSSIFKRMTLWKMKRSPSRYYPQLRKLLFLLYKQLFGTDVPKVYGSQLQSVGIVRMNFDGTPLELYPAMVGPIAMLHPRWIQFTLVRGKKPLWLSESGVSVGNRLMAEKRFKKVQGQRHIDQSSCEGEFNSSLLICLLKERSVLLVLGRQEYWS